MDNYFILSPKEGEECIIEAPNMTSVKLETCILITDTYCLLGGSYHFLRDERTIIGESILLPSYHCT
jgi:hypothetical protein